MAEEYDNATADSVDAIINASGELRADDVTAQPTSVACDRPPIDVGYLDGSVTLSTESNTVSDTEDFKGIEPTNNRSEVDQVSSTDATASLKTDLSPPPPSTCEPNVSLPSTSLVSVSPADGIPDITDDVNQLLNQTQGSSFESSQSTTSHDSAETVQSLHQQPNPDTELVDSNFATAPHPTEAEHSESASTGAVQSRDVAEDADTSAPTTATVDGHVTNPSDAVDAVEQPAPPEQPPPPTAEFKAGITCSDVPTALDILNTRYLLSDVTIHKNMITWSSWNIADMVRGPHRESFWWRGRRRGRQVVQQSATEADQPSDTAEAIAPKCHLSDQPVQNGPGEVAVVKDIEVLSEKIEQKEREIELMLQRNELRLQQQLADAASTSRGVDEEEISPNAANTTCAEPGALRQEPEQQKRENLFQRLLRALRQRFSRQQHGGETGNGQKHETSSLQDHRSSSANRRQRTL